MKKNRMFQYIPLVILLSSCALRSTKTNTPISLSKMDVLLPTAVSAQLLETITPTSSTIPPQTAIKSLVSFTPVASSTATIKPNTSTPLPSPNPTQTLTSTPTPMNTPVP